MAWASTAWSTRTRRLGAIQLTHSGCRLEFGFRFRISMGSGSESVRGESARRLAPTKTSLLAL